MVLGPSRPLAPLIIVRFAISLLVAILACRLVPYALGAAYYDGIAPPGTRLASDVAAYLCCIFALVLPPSRFFFTPSPQSEIYESVRSGAHRKYGHDILAQTSHARDTLAQAIWDSLLAPFAPVTFWHVIVADYLTSLAKALGDTHITACVTIRATWLENMNHEEEFYDNHAYNSNHSVWWEQRRGPCAASFFNASALALPFWCRFFQCLAVYKQTRQPKNLWNALKYATAFPLIYTGHLEKQHPATYKHIFILCAIIQSTATFTWDILMDWTLFKPRTGGLLCGLFDFFTFRDSLLLPQQLHAPFSFLLLIFDLALRFAWTLSVFADFSTRGSGMFFFELIEIIRRTVWALFRIEWEYIHQGCDLVDSIHRRKSKLKNPKDRGAVELMQIHDNQGPTATASLLDDTDDITPVVPDVDEAEEEEEPTAISV